MQRPALVTSTLPHLKRTQPFRAASQTEHTWELYRSRTTRITPPVAIDLYDRVLRSIDQPASCTDFAIPCLRQLLRAHICDVDLPVMPHETVRHHLQEMPTSSRMLRRTRPDIASCYRDVFCGRRPISLCQPAALRWRSSSSMSSNRGSALPPRLKGEASAR
jgi:hypothetical protein